MARRRWAAGLAVACSMLLSAAATDAQAVAARWDAANVRGLLEVVATAGDEGLDVDSYGAEQLRAALGDHEPNVAARADAIALALAHDFFEGRIPLAQRPDWHFARPDVDYQGWLDAATATHSIRGSFAKLLPQGSQYSALRQALLKCRSERQDCSSIETNLDRWRALPRDFGRKYLWVNVPAYRLDLIENGEVIESHRVIVGKPGTVTPLFRTMATGVTANPWWNVPCSIVDESIGKLIRTNPAEAARRGYVATVDAQGKLVVRQKPGPANALGQLKIEMPNPYGVYIHDTPSRDLFNHDARALSHGCIRTEQPTSLARALLGPDRTDTLDKTLMTGETRTIGLLEPLPVYVVYLTVEPDPAVPGGILHHEDIYHRD